MALPNELDIDFNEMNIPILQTLSTPKHFVNRPHSFHFQIEIEIENDQPS